MKQIDGKAIDLVANELDKFVDASDYSRKLAARGAIIVYEKFKDSQQVSLVEAENKLTPERIVRVIDDLFDDLRKRIDIGNCIGDIDDNNEYSYPMGQSTFWALDQLLEDAKAILIKKETDDAANTSKNDK